MWFNTDMVGSDRTSGVRLLVFVLVAMGVQYDIKGPQRSMESSRVAIHSLFRKVLCQMSLRRASASIGQCLSGLARR